MFAPRAFTFALVPAGRVLQLVSRSSAPVRNLQPLLRQQLRPFASDGSPSPSGRGTQLFRQQDLPTLDFWQRWVSEQRLEGLTAEHLLNAARRYCEVATNHSSAWKRSLETDHNIDLYTLHHTAAALWFWAFHQKLSIHMLLTASELGYEPSTLSLMAQVVQDPGYDQKSLSGRFRDLHEHFKRLLLTRGGPDSLTVQGLAFLRLGDESAALRYFDRAIAAAGSEANPQPITISPLGSANDRAATRKPRWWYEGLCQEKRGLVLLKQGRLGEAAAAFRVAALELGLQESYFQLAKLVPQGRPERETYLLRAAQAGNFEACRCLALDAADKATQPGLPQAEREDMANMAQEWARLEPDAVKRRELMSLLTHKLKGVAKLRSIS